MAFGNIESWVKAILVVGFFTATMAPVLYATLPPSVAKQLNLTSYNQTANLNNLIFKQVNNTVFCGSANLSRTCNATTSQGGVYANTGLLQSFAFILNGFGDFVASMINAPQITGVWIGEAIHLIPLNLAPNSSVQHEASQFMSFLMLIVCVSALVKYPLRSG